ncbi:MAG: hypothetical protein K2L45_09770 [Muribaculaceae bacterium]|nr:hypothetical protein [Muribaculaceae bacterium]
MDDKDIDYIADYYSDDVFSPENGWRKFKYAIGLRRKRYGIAAAVAAVIAVSSTAAIISYENHRNDTNAVESVSEMKGMTDVEETRVLEFDHTKLTDVVETVEAEYSVEIGNIPVNADDYELTLRYEGTPSELIEAINEILGTHLTLFEE